jgi:hypothetical protein
MNLKPVIIHEGTYNRAAFIGDVSLKKSKESRTFMKKTQLNFWWFSISL